MNVLRRAQQNMAAGIELVGGYRGTAGMWGSWFNAGSQFDWGKYVGDPWQNCVVWLALEFYKRNWSQAPLQVQDFRDDKWVAAKDQSLAMALDEPNDWYDGNTLFQATVLSHFSAGNWYWLDWRRNNGWPAPFLLWHNLITPNTTSGKWIDEYLYMQPGGGYKSLSPEIVIHGRNGLGNPDQRLGVAPLSACYRSIGSDNLGEIFDGALLHKMGVPGLTFTGKMTPAEATALNKKVDEKFTVDGAGSTLVAGVDLTVTSLKATPRDMMLGEMRKLPVGRICGVFGIDPGVIALPSDTSKHHANFDAMLKAAWTQGIRPVKDDFARTLTHWYRKTGHLKDGQRLGWDYSQVSELQEDRTATADIAEKLFTAGIITRNEALGMVGMDPVDGGDVYKDDAQGQSPEAQKVKQMAWESAFRLRQAAENSDTPDED